MVIIHSIALLLSLRGVDAVEPDLGVAYMDCVTVNNAGFACYIGHHNRHGQDQD